MTTNIKPDHQEAFNALRNPTFSNFALFSCFVNGAPTSAVVAINEAEGGDVIISPLFVAVTDDTVLTDHDGVETAEQAA